VAASGLVQLAPFLIASVGELDFPAWNPAIASQAMAGSISGPEPLTRSCTKCKAVPATLDSRSHAVCRYYHPRSTTIAVKVNPISATASPNSSQPNVSSKWASWVKKPAQATNTALPGDIFSAFHGEHHLPLCSICLTRTSPSSLPAPAPRPFNSASSTSIHHLLMTP